MAKKLLFLPILILSMFLFANYSQSNVLVNDAGSNAEIELSTSAVVPTGSGQIGDYELIFCGLQPIAPDIMFSDPTPGTWETLDTGISVGDGQTALGIWGRFTDNLASEDISCNWNVLSRFTAGSFRYDGVDRDNPIIAVACNTGGSEVAVAPSVNTLPGSQVVRIFARIMDFEFPPFFTHMSSNDEVSGSSSSVTGFSGELFLLDATTQLLFIDGPTGEDSVSVEGGLF